MRNFCIAFTFVLLFTGCIRTSTTQKKDIISPFFLQHNGTQLGVLPDLGGTVVFLSDKDGNNILKSDRNLWYLHKDELPTMSSCEEPIALNGHTVWLGPQEDWWAQQNVDPRMKRKKPTWPPDPYLTLGKYTILDKSDSSIVLESQPSPFSGIQFVKTITITGPGKIDFHVKATNIRNTPVRWDLWMNTRVEGQCTCYVPVTGIDGIKQIKGDQSDRVYSIFYTTENGYFTYLPAQTPPGDTKTTSKAFLIPTNPMIAVFNNGTLFVKRFAPYSSESIHPDQAPVEIYVEHHSDSKKDMVELEHHSPYRTLEPGESMEDSETWEIYSYNGSPDRKTQTEFLKGLEE